MIQNIGQNIGKNAAILAVFALITTALIALTNYVTAPRIAAAQEQQLQGILNELVPEHMHDNPLSRDCTLVSADPLLGSNPLADNIQTHRVFRARQQGSNIAAIIETTTPDGYSGNIDLVVAIASNGQTLGARVIKHKETPGLGDKIDTRISDWILSFEGVPIQAGDLQRWRVKKDGGQFDQFTGATITPRAVVSAVRDTGLYFMREQAGLFAAPSNCEQSVMEPELSVSADADNSGIRNDN